MPQVPDYKARRILKWIAVVVISLGVLVGVIAIIQAIDNGLFRYENRVAYKTGSWETQDTIKVKHISKEKGKETIYTVDSAWGGETQIPENIYLQYIGEENNTVTIRIEKLTIYIATKSSGFDETQAITFRRISWPWEEKPHAFSYDEIVEAINELEDTAQPWELWTKSTYTQWSELDFSFQFDSVAWGIHNRNCLNEGAIKYTDDYPIAYATTPITLIANLLLPVGALFMAFPLFYQHDGAVQKKMGKVSKIIGWTLCGIGSILNWIGSGTITVIVSFCLVLTLNLAAQYVVLQEKQNNK